MKAVALLVCLMAFAGEVACQNDIQLSQQMFSRNNNNPAATGQSEDLYLFLLARQQWLGFSRAPQTVVLNGHTYMPGMRSGLGFSIIGDRLGFEKSINPKIQYAYHIPFIYSRSMLSLGLSLGGLYRAIDYSKAVYENPLDPEQQYDSRGQIRPDFDFGLEFNARHVQAGLSITHVGNRIKNNLPLESTPHGYVYVRGLIDINRNWRFTPALSWHTTHFVNQIEGNLTLAMKERFWFGASYRWQESIVFLAGVYLTPNFMLGYSYDYSSISFNKYETGSHELMLSLRIPQPKKRMRAEMLRECYHHWW